METTHIPAYVLAPGRPTPKTPQFAARSPVPGFIKDIEAGRVALPMIPRIVRRLSSALDSPEVDLHEVSMTVARDPVLSAKVLRLANSSLVGRQRVTASIEAAVGVIGLDALRRLLAAAGPAVEPNATVGIDLGAFWHHALVTAVAANKLAPVVGADPAEAYSCGLLHSTGHLILSRCHPDIADAMFAGWPMMRGADLAMVEKEAFGIDHAAAGALWVDTLDFPRHIVAVIREQLTTADDALDPLALALRSARLLAAAVARKDDARAALRTLAPAIRDRLTHDEGRPKSGFATFYDALRAIKTKR